jgi:NitT/TauT family transport system permease protein
MIPVTNRMAFTERRDRRLLSVVALVGLLAGWEALCRVGVVRPVFLPAPLAVLDEGIRMVASGDLLGHIGASLGRLAAGFALGSLAGIAAGIALGFFETAEAVGTPIINALFPIPKIALLPLLILWLGIDESSKIAVIALGVFFPMAINTHAGVRHVDPVLVRAAVSLGAGRRSVIRKVIVPAALPTIFAGFKVGAGIALLVLVAAEIINARRGLGAMINSAGDLMQTTKLMVGLVVLSLLGLASAWGLNALERWLLPWKEL